MNNEVRQQKSTTCCATTAEKRLDEKYWNDQYAAQETGWDLGTVSPPIRSYIDTLTEKNIRILIPGCGNSYEAEYLLQNGFTNVTVIDIAPLVVEKLRKKFENNTGIRIIHADFFDHDEKYDLILEQTFFCALLPPLRNSYVKKMSELLNDKGVLAGVLFNRNFEKNPPYGGSREEYETLFQPAFQIQKMETCNNSYPARANTELWIEFIKK
jgi:SAM-dependent methyltransferase